jgi:hypothetical protein
MTMPSPLVATGWVQEHGLLLPDDGSNAFEAFAVGPEDTELVVVMDDSAITHGARVSLVGHSGRARWLHARHVIWRGSRA